MLLDWEYIMLDFYGCFGLTRQKQCDETTPFDIITYNLLQQKQGKIDDFTSS